MNKLKEKVLKEIDALGSAELNEVLDCIEALKNHNNESVDRYLESRKEDGEWFEWCCQEVS